MSSVSETCDSTVQPGAIVQDTVFTYMYIIIEYQYIGKPLAISVKYWLLFFNMCIKVRFLYELQSCDLVEIGNSPYIK